MSKLQDYRTSLKFEYLPDYAAFILKEKLLDFIKLLTSASYEANIPMLKYFDSMSEEDKLKLSIESNTRLLTALQTNPMGYIEFSKENWLNNMLPIVTRDQIIVEDIMLVNYVRKKAFAGMLHYFTQDPSTLIKILDEIDRFILTFNMILFNAYLDLQQEKLKEFNETLQKRESELLEAQAIARVGSFEWDFHERSNSKYTPELFKIFEMEGGATNLESFLDDVHPDDRPKLQEAIQKAMTEGSYECEYRFTRNKKLKTLYSKGRIHFIDNKAVSMIGTVTDITETASLISKLKLSEDLNKQAQALANLGNWKWTLEDESIEWSDEMYRIYGMEPQSERITFERFIGFIHPDDRNRRLGEINEAMKTGVASDYIMRIVSQDGIEKVLRGKGEVLPDDHKRSRGMMGICQDITKEYQLRVELERKNDELLRKNRDLEAFNFIASHDLLEPLRKIQIYGNRISDEGGSEIPEHLLKYFEKISQASNRMQSMIEDFIVFYQFMNVEEPVETINLISVIQNVVKDFQEEIRNKSVSVQVGNLPAISARKSHITQLFRQLISNAIKFSRVDSPLKVQINSTIEEMDNLRYLKISIQDNGIGFDQQYETKIFELFQKLHSKDEYTGTGIGLSLCQKIVEGYNGKITVTSEEGMGSVFMIYLPEK